MTQMGREDVLFSEEIVPWDQVLRLVINLIIPFRHGAKGIECITGRRGHFRLSTDAPLKWVPFVVDEYYLKFIREHLQELPSLEYPVPIGIANDFIDKFIMLKDSPDTVPTFLTRTSLSADQQQRTSLFMLEKEQLKQLVSEGNVFLVDASRRKCNHLMPDVYFSKREAIQYLDKKGLLDRAFAAGCSWRDQIREPEVGGLPAPTENIFYGLPEELISMGIPEYRKTLTLRKSEVVASQLAKLLPKLVEGEQIIEEDLVVINAPSTLTEPVLGVIRSEPNLAVDLVPPIPASSPSAIGNNSVKSSSSEHPIVSKDDKAKSAQENYAIASEMALLSEGNSVVKKFIGMQAVMNRLGVSRPTIYNYLNPNSPSYNPNFPQPVKLNSENKWVEAEINAFMEAPTLLKKKR